MLTAAAGMGLDMHDLLNPDLSQAQATVLSRFDGVGAQVKVRTEAAGECD